MKTAVLIPAYQPDEKLIALVEGLLNQGFSQIWIVNDGSRLECGPVFERAESLGCRVIHHSENRGKGAALKTGFAALLEEGSLAGCVTVDADGQHLPEDALHLAEKMEETGSFVLGRRCFEADNVPLKSRLGNKITRTVFRLLTGQAVRDTQTGLRAIPFGWMEICATLAGDRYDYEMNMLIEAARRGIGIQEVPIRTVYMDNNRGSHFRAVADGAKIYKLIFKFALSSGLSFLVDIGLFTALTVCVLPPAMPYRIFWGTFLARLISSVVNYCTNKTLVFQSKEKGAVPLFRYYALCAAQMLASWLLLEAASKSGLNLTLLKLLVDGFLFLLSFFIQKIFVFKRSAAE